MVLYSPDKNSMNFNNRLTQKDIQNIEIYANAKVLNKVLRFFMKSFPLVNIKYSEFINDLLISLGCKSSGYTREEINQAELWEKATKDMKKQILENDKNINPELLKKIQKEESERGERIFTAFILLNLFLLENAYYNNEPHEILKELWETVSYCLGGNKDPECIENTDHSVNLSILFKVLIRTAGSYDEAFFLNQIQSLLSKFIPMLSST